MPVLISLMAWALVAFPVLALAVYCVEIVVGLRKPAAKPVPASVRGPVVLLVPAHNEAAGIEATLAGFRAVMPAGCRILVIADNCTDDTALRARVAGAEVAERFDAERRGKGYALAHGRDLLAKDPPHTVIVVDADAHLAPGSIEHLCRVAETGVAAQATYLMIADRSAPALMQISNFAFLIKNLVRSRGLERIGHCALLTGSGMAFPWSVYADAPLASGNITEDLGLGISLTRAGIDIRLVGDAVVLSQAASLSAGVAQRRRWEHGFLANAKLHALPLLGAGLRQGLRSMIALGLHLLVPPLALLMMLAGAVVVVEVLVGLLWSVWHPAIMLGGLTLAALVLTGIAWLRFGRETLRLDALLLAPLYVVMKLPLYLRFLVKPETRWQRTERNGSNTKSH